MNSENLKTAKELAAELGVSANTIYRRLKAIDQGGTYTEKIGGVIRITQDGANIIRNQLRQPTGSTAAAETLTGPRSIDTATQALIDMQRAHIETLTRQLDSANRQLEMERQTRLMEADNERRRLAEPAQYRAAYNEQNENAAEGIDPSSFHAENDTVKTSRESLEKMRKDEKTQKRSVINRLRDMMKRI